MSRRNVLYNIKRLIEKGYIAKTPGGGRSRPNQYVLKYKVPLEPRGHEAELQRPNGSNLQMSVKVKSKPNPNNFCP
jgi:hypothetical protein